MTDTSDPTPSPLTALMWLTILPAFIVVGLLCLSPNYRFDDSVNQEKLDYPLGGDFLQEYVGGGLIRDSLQRENLYQADTFQTAQHDDAIVGFKWDEQQFFPAVYPPFWYAVVSPLSDVTYSIASRIWLVLMAMALVAAGWLMNRYAKSPMLILIAMCLSTPVIQSLNAGQKGTLLLLILSGSCVLLRQRRYFLSGLVFASIAFKPHLAVAIGLWMLTSRNWKWCQGAFIGLAALTVASIGIDTGLLKEYLHVVSGFGNYVQSGGYNLSESFSLWSFWQQLIPVSWLSKTLTILSSLIVLGYSLWAFGRRSSDQLSMEEMDWIFAGMVIVTVVISPHLYIYDLTILLLPVALLTRIAVNQRQKPSTDAGSGYIVWLPVGLLVTLMFANGAFTGFAQSFGIQLGVPLLLAAWLMITQRFFAAPARAS